MYKNREIQAPTPFVLERGEGTFKVANFERSGEWHRPKGALFPSPSLERVARRPGVVEKVRYLSGWMNVSSQRAAPVFLLLEEDVAAVPRKAVTDGGGDPLPSNTAFDKR